MLLDVSAAGFFAVAFPIHGRMPVVRTGTRGGRFISATVCTTVLYSHNVWLAVRCGL
jgi:hypothetical protein